MSERIATMELSRFWKVRNAVFALRKRLGLSPVGAMEPFAIDPVEWSIGAAGGPYGQWLAGHAARPSDLDRMREASNVFPRRPVFALLCDATNAEVGDLRATIDSVCAQAYPDWELVVGGAATSAAVEGQLDAYAERDRRIRRTGTNPLSSASGDFVAWLDPGDLLAPDACYEAALLVNRDPTLDMAYSDEDELAADGTLGNPHFKPDWSPDTFLSRPYTGRFAVYRRARIAAFVGDPDVFRAGIEVELVLRLGDGDARILHVPRVLYHRRAGAPAYAPPLASGAIAAALERRGEPGTVVPHESVPGVFRVRYRLAARERVSIILPTRDHGDDVDRVLQSVFANAGYPDFEVLLVDNGSRDERSIARFAAWAENEPRVRVLRYDVPFNYAEINNWAAAHASGTYLLLLNNDTEILSADWLDALVEQAQRPSIAAVGALLLYDDDTVQHAGVVIGINGVAGHSHKHAHRSAPGHHGTLHAVTNYSAVTAACMMVRKAVYDELGGLDEDLAVAFNDVDFCLRAVAAGYRNVWLPHVVLRHVESKSRGLDTTFGRRRTLHREEAHMQRRWRTSEVPDPYYNPNLTLRAEDFSIRSDR